MRTGFDSGNKERFGSVGIGESEIVYICLYPNRWVLVNGLKISATGDIKKYHKLPQISDM